MATTTQSPVTHADHFLPPAQLWIGEHQSVVAQVVTYLQNIFCIDNGCQTCVVCRQISEQQHHSVTWLYPEKQYTLDQLEVIVHTISFALNEDQHHFFVIQKADFLTPACGNSLLKSIEEPPPGYHFILLAERPEQILITIRSRCVAQSYTAEKNIAENNPLFALFSSNRPATPSAFLKALDEAQPNERSSVELIDQLLAYWIEQYKKTIINNQPQQGKIVQNTVRTLYRIMQKPPMSGSSKLFWKNLFLQLKK